MSPLMLPRVQVARKHGHSIFPEVLLHRFNQQQQPLVPTRYGSPAYAEEKHRFTGCSLLIFLFYP